MKFVQLVMSKFDLGLKKKLVIYEENSKGYKKLAFNHNP